MELSLSSVNAECETIINFAHQNFSTCVELTKTANMLSDKHPFFLFISSKIEMNFENKKHLLVPSDTNLAVSLVCSLYAKLS